MRKEHKFLINIFLEKDLKKSQTLKNLTAYYDTFQNFLLLVTYTEAVINDSTEFKETLNDDLRVFCKENSTGFSNFSELASKIKEVEIKNKHFKISNFTLQNWGFVYSWLIDFSLSKF